MWPMVLCLPPPPPPPSLSPTYMPCLRPQRTLPFTSADALWPAECRGKFAVSQQHRPMLQMLAGQICAIHLLKDTNHGDTWKQWPRCTDNARSGAISITGAAPWARIPDPTHTILYGSFWSSLMEPALPPVHIQQLQCTPTMLCLPAILCDPRILWPTSDLSGSGDQRPNSAVFRAEVPAT